MSNQPNQPDQPTNLPRSPMYQEAENAQQQLNQAQQPSGGAVQPYQPAPGDQIYRLSPGSYPQQVKPRSPALGAVLSFFVPGLGQLATGRAGMGVLMFSLWALSWVLTLAIVGFVTLPIVWLWAMIDGYHGAKKWNQKHGIVS